MVKNKRYRFIHDKNPLKVKERNAISVDFYLHLTHHCAIGNHALVLTFQLDKSKAHTEEDVLVVSSHLVVVPDRKALVQ